MQGAAFYFVLCSISSHFTAGTLLIHTTDKGSREYKGVRIFRGLTRPPLSLLQLTPCRLPYSSTLSARGETNFNMSLSPSDANQVTATTDYASVDLQVALERSLETGTFIDTKIYAFSRRRDGLLVDKPLPIFANSELLQARSVYFDNCAYF